jgi:hypothetical protein
MKRDIDRSSLAAVIGGVHIVAGIKNARTGVWESKQEFHIPDPKPAPPPTPMHVIAGIKNAKTGEWESKQEFHYLKP